jgi:hypothetical protein
MGVKRILKDWIVPPGFYNLKQRIEQREKNQQISEKEPVHFLNTGNGLSNFKDKYIGKRCFILATGPSIATQDLSVLEGEHCIAVSMFHLHEEIRKIKPIWHVLAPVHSPFKLDTSKKIIDTCYDRYKGFEDINFLVGHSSYEYAYKEYIRNENNQFESEFKNRIHYLDYNKSYSITEQNYSSNDIWDLEKNPFGIRTVIFPAIQLAYYLGFKEIILLGCDHDYLLDLTKEESQHFYPEKEGFSDKETFSSANLEEWFYTYYILWKEYRLIRTYMNEQNVEILNATNGGMLDVFPRVKFESLF